MSPAPRDTLAARLQSGWWRPRLTWLCAALVPLALLYRALWQLNSWSFRWGLRTAQRMPVPVVVVGNFIVGGAGKSPTTLALLQALQHAGWTPGVVSRGHGRRAADIREVTVDDSAQTVGDEPLWLARRAGVPVFVGRQRPASARALLARHPQCDLILSDDGLQHLALARDVEVVIFDSRGRGNGWCLPAGPLREPLRKPRPEDVPVLYNADRASTPLAGLCAQRRLHRARPLAHWAAGRTDADEPMSRFSGRTVLATAGIAEPERFFSMLRDGGVQVEPLPLPDHYGFDDWPWPSGCTEVLVTEKDAVKMIGRDTAGTQVWVVPLDFALPAGLVQAVCAALARAGFHPNKPTECPPTAN